MLGDRAWFRVDWLRKLLLVALVLLSTAAAHAESITLLRPSSSSPALDEALFRVQGELLALGLTVKIADRPASDPADEPDAWLRRMASEGPLDAVIALEGTTAPTAVDIWIFQAGRAPQLTRVGVEPGTENVAETLAIRAIEVLRANFVAIDLAASGRARAEVAKVEPAKPAPPAPAPAPTRTQEHLGLQAGVTLLTSLDGVGPALLPLVRFDWALDTRLVMQATLAGFGTQPTVESAAGTAQVNQHFALLGLCYCSPSSAELRPLASLAAGALRTALDGEAESPELGHAVEQWSFLAEASLGARLRLARRYYLTLAGHVQLAEPYVAVHFVDELVATSGRPNLLASLTVGAWL